jgi:fluoride ion exporter CrcB/FEX
MITNCLIIGAGGFIGAVTRYVPAAWIGQKEGMN